MKYDRKRRPMFDTRPLVYIAGPYTQGDPVLNTREAVRWGEEIEAKDCDVVIPHLTMLWHLVSPAPIERWYARDLALLARCDAIVRFPGLSGGADKEVEFARERSIPTFIVVSIPAFWIEFDRWVEETGN